MNHFPKFLKFLCGMLVIVSYVMQLASCDVDNGPTRLQGRLAFTVNPDSTTNGFIRVSGLSFNFPTDNVEFHDSYDLAADGSFDITIPESDEVEYYSLSVWTSGSRPENVYRSIDGRLICHGLDCERFDPGKRYRDVILEVDTR